MGYIELLQSPPGSLSVTRAGRAPGLGAFEVGKKLPDVGQELPQSALLQSPWKILLSSRRVWFHDRMIFLLFQTEGRLYNSMCYGFYDIASF